MRSTQQGMSLIELMVAMAILAVTLTGVGITLLRLDQANIYQHDKALAYKAAQQVLEVINNESLTDAVARNNQTFDVYGMTSCSGTSLGLIEVQDLGWDSTSGDSYLFTIDVTDMNGSPNRTSGNSSLNKNGENYARLFAVRTSQ